MIVARILAVVVLSGLCMAMTEADTLDAASAREHRGLMFTYGMDLHRSSASAFARGGYGVQVMVGYCVSPTWYFTVGVITGSDQVQWNGYPGNLRQLSVGGARVQTEWFPFSPDAAIRPFAALSWDMVTQLTHEPGQMTSGFSGGGPRIAAGASWEISRFLAIALQGSYSAPRLWNAVNAGPPENVPFIDRIVALEFTISCFPNIVP